MIMLALWAVLCALWLYWVYVLFPDDVLPVSKGLLSLLPLVRLCGAIVSLVFWYVWNVANFNKTNALYLILLYCCYDAMSSLFCVWHITTVFIRLDCALTADMCDIQRASVLYILFPVLEAGKLSSLSSADFQVFNSFYMSILLNSPVQSSCTCSWR